MSAEQKELEQNALASRLGRLWTNFKQGKLISYKVMAVILLAAAGLGLWWYIAAERKKGASKLWLEYDEANTTEKLQELIKKDPKANPTAKPAAYNLACDLLGPQGINMVSGNARPEEYQRGLENIEKAREEFIKLLDQFKDDPPHKAACLRALVSAETMLMRVPAKSDQPTGPGPVAPPTKFKGEASKLLEYLDQLVAAAPDTPWATQSKKWADDLRKDPGNFARIQAELATPGPTLSKGGIDPFGPGPFAP